MWISRWRFRSNEHNSNRRKTIHKSGPIGLSVVSSVPASMHKDPYVCLSACLFLSVCLYDLLCMFSCVCVCLFAFVCVCGPEGTLNSFPSECNGRLGRLPYQAVP
jgi:hypothetical protein